MSAAEEVQGYLRLAAGERNWGDTVERGIERAGRALGIPYSRAFAYWYGKVRRPCADEVDAIRQRAALLLQAMERRVETLTTRNDQRWAALGLDPAGGTDELVDQVAAAVVARLGGMAGKPEPGLGRLSPGAEGTPHREGADVVAAPALESVRGR